MLAILFEMDGRLWGADARLVETVVPAVRLRGVQGAPEWIAGVFNYKGNTVFCDVPHLLNIPIILAAVSESMSFSIFNICAISPSTVKIPPQ